MNTTAQNQDKKISRWLLPALSYAALLIVILVAAFAAGPVAAATKIVAALVLLLALGFGCGAVALTVNNVFRNRAANAYQTLRQRPKASLAAGAAVSAATLLLLALLGVAPALQLLVLLAYLGLVGLFGLAAAIRLLGQHVGSGSSTELPSAGAHVTGGVVLMALNVVPIVGSLLFIGLLLAGIGAASLRYLAAVRAGGSKAIDGEPSAASAEPSAAAGEPS